MRNLLSNLHKKIKNDIDIFAILLQITTNFFFLSSNYVVYNYFLIRWFRESDYNYQIVNWIELDYLGMSLLFLYDFVFLIAFTSYQRASFSDPGYMK